MHEHNTALEPDGPPTGRAALYVEIVHHLPFSVSAVAIGMTLAGIICFLTPAERAPRPHADPPGRAEAADRPTTTGERPVDGDEVSRRRGASEEPHGPPRGDAFETLFHLFHPLHMLFSAAATTAMFWRYERRAGKAVITGLIGAIGVCGLSDIVMPQLSLTMLGMPVPWHLCVLDHPRMVLSFAAVGVLVGLAAAAGVERSTFFSHSLHVFSSTMATIFYLIRPFGVVGWIDSVGVVFLFVILAVMVPCCLSDIVFPLCLAGRARGCYRDDHADCG